MVAVAFGFAALAAWREAEVTVFLAKVSCVVRGNCWAWDAAVTPAAACCAAASAAAAFC